MTQMQSNTDKTVTITLPAAIYRQLSRVALQTQQQLEELAAQSIAGNLPPTVENAPVDVQPELLAMQRIPAEALKAIAYERVTAEDQSRHMMLLDQNQAGLLAGEEQKELHALRLKSDHLMVRKAYAWALLRWRGQRIPPLSEIPLE